MSRAKVLLVGPVNGRLRLLSEKLQTLQRSKAGPFDICLCSGPFFYRTTVAAQSTEDDIQQNERNKVKEEAIRDGKDLADGLLKFDVPVLFVDVGDGLPEAMKDKLSTALEALKKDGDEIDLDDDVSEGEDGAKNEKSEEEDANNMAAKSSLKGLFRIAYNLYQLVGDDPRRQSHILDGVADIVSVPLPLVDPQSSDNISNRHAISLTIGFLGSKFRLPCKSFEEKAKHTSFLGCDVLLSGEWGQGMSSLKCGALTAEDRSSLMTAYSDVLRDARYGEGKESFELMGSWDVAELVTMCRARYHVAPGLFQLSHDGRLQQKYISSLPYRYPATSSSSEEGSHTGRFHAMGSVVSSLREKLLGKAFKFIHAVGIVPLSYMDASEQVSAKELNLAVGCPYVSNNIIDSEVNGLGEFRGTQDHSTKIAKPRQDGKRSSRGVHNLQQRPLKRNEKIEDVALDSSVAGLEWDEAMGLSAHELLSAPGHASKYVEGQWICSSKCKYQQYICRFKASCNKKIRTYCSCTPEMWMCIKCHLEHVTGDLLESRTPYLAKGAEQRLGGEESSQSIDNLQENPLRERKNFQGVVSDSSFAGLERDEAMGLLCTHELVNAPTHASKYVEGQWICSSKSKYQQYTCRFKKSCRKRIRTCCACTPDMWMCIKCHVEHVVQSTVI
jgi:hypothetical protein